MRKQLTFKKIEQSSDQSLKITYRITMWFWRIAWKELKEQSDITVTFLAQKANTAIKYWLWEQSS